MVGCFQFSRDRGKNYVIFGTQIGEGDNKQQLHGITLRAEERKEKQNDISVSRKLDVDALKRYLV